MPQDWVTASFYRAVLQHQNLLYLLGLYFYYIWSDIHLCDHATTLGHHMTDVLTASTHAYVCFT